MNKKSIWVVSIVLSMFLLYGYQINTQDQNEDIKQRKLWHNDAWHNGYQVFDGKNVIIKAYLRNGKIITLTPAELAISDAKKEQEWGIKK